MVTSLVGALVPPAALLGGAAIRGALFALGDPDAVREWQNMTDGTQSGQIAVMKLGIVMMILSATACTIVSISQTRRYAFTTRQRRWWPVFVALTGPAGLLTMWSLLDWPARETCPNCGRKRVVGRDLCEHCEAPFARPVPDGTEIFDT